MGDRNRKGAEKFKPFDSPKAKQMVADRMKETLVSRLRGFGKPNIAIYHTEALLNETADELERQAKEITALKSRLGKLGYDEKEIDSFAKGE